MKSSLIIVIFFLSIGAFAADRRTDGVVIPLGAATQLLIPAAGSTAGNNGTFFRSDIAIVNLSNHEQRVQLQWIPQSGNLGSTSFVTIPALSGIRSADFVSTTLGQAGIGSIIVTGVNADNTRDSTAALWVSSRIWTPQPGTSGGTTSQSLPAIPTSTVNTQAAALFAVGGADNPLNYRVNVGIVNLDPVNAQTFVISQPSSIAPFPAPITVTIAAMSMQQVNIGNGLGPTQQVLIQNTTAIGARSTSWIAYGSTVDNITGDAWSELAVSGTTP